MDHNMIRSRLRNEFPLNWLTDNSRSLAAFKYECSQDFDRFSGDVAANNMSNFEASQWAKITMCAK